MYTCVCVFVCLFILFIFFIILHSRGGCVLYLQNSSKRSNWSENDYRDKLFFFTTTKGSRQTFRSLIYYSKWNNWVCIKGCDILLNVYAKLTITNLNVVINTSNTDVSYYTVLCKNINKWNIFKNNNMLFKKIQRKTIDKKVFRFL